MNTQNSFTVLSTFSGCGGSSLGYQLAGGKVLLAVEWDDNAVATYRLNFPDTPIYHGDIGKLSVEECCERAGIEPGELDILDGSPPCQGFSLAGKRDFGDDRNQLFREYVRLLRGLQPKVFVMENVSGMVKGKMKLIFAECLRELKASGYRVKARVLNAMYFNVPQSRQRMIFVGVRDDIGIEPSHPKGRSRPVCMRDVLPITHARYDTKGSFAKRTFNPARDVFPTITKGNRCHIPCRITGSSERYLTPDEGKLFASFPEGFRFVGGVRDQWERIGNSVPPNFMRAIAEHIRDNILTPKLGLTPRLSE